MSVSILDRIKLQQASQQKRNDEKPSETVDVIVLDIRPTQQIRKMKNGTELKVFQVVTKDHGSFFPMENAIANPIKSFGDGVKAKLTLQANDYKDSTGADVNGINCTRVVLEAIDAKYEAAIGLLSKGAALFGSM